MTPPGPTPTPTLGQGLDAAISGVGDATSSTEDAVVEISTTDADRLGVVVQRLRVRRAGHAPVAEIPERIHAIARAVRPAGERLVPVEIAPRLGGGTLRTRPEDLRGGRFFQIDVDLAGAELTRFRVDPEHGRTAEPFTLTREELGRLVNDLADTLDAMPGHPRAN